MSEVQQRDRVAAVVPAFNEGATIAAVVEALLGARGLDEILVVSDGSTDDTVKIARSLGVRTIELQCNSGKAAAMAAGLQHTTAPIVLFVDGDILDLDPRVVDDLVRPVTEGRCAMSIGIRHRGAFLNAWHCRFGPLLSGIRCLHRDVFAAVPAEYIDGFKIETALNWACRQLGLRHECTVLYGLRHNVKEKKRGLGPGMRARIEMFASVFFAWSALQQRSLVSRPQATRGPVPERVGF